MNFPHKRLFRLFAIPFHCKFYTKGANIKSIVKQMRKGDLMTQRKAQRKGTGMIRTPLQRQEHGD
jgi:hypothetical protein